MKAFGLLIALVFSVPLTRADDPKPEAPMSEVVRETYEWSNIWWDHAEDTKLPRVLLIGDSISCGYSPVVTKLLEGKVHVDRLGTSRSINDPVLIKETTMMLEDCRYVAIHFNNGLHGFHLTGPQYASALRRYVKLLQEHGRGAKLIWGSSTPITKGNDTATLDEKNGTVTARNALAAEIMEEQGIPINDLYQLVVGKAELRSPDGYHYNGDGYAVLGKAMAEALTNAM
jgi:lysophospholipase L1-like esterase